MAGNFVVLGGGIAGFTAAAELRRLLPEAAVTLVCGEPELPYLRPLLSKTDLRSFQRDKTRLAPESWYAERNIRVLTGRRAERLDPAGHTVTLADGQTLPYDKCIYALGADCFVPPMPGTDKKGVLTLRSLADFRALRRLACTAKRAVVIGGGVIGLEMAEELVRMGLGCTILEAAPRLMPRQLDPESSARLARRIRAHGVGCHVGVQVAELTGAESVTGVLLTDGRHFPAELVIVSCGVRPVTAPAQTAGLTCRRGVVTDETLRTSDPDIYAAGDCIECPAPNPGLWGYAQRSGLLAARNAARPNAPEAFTGGSYPLLMSTMGTSLFALGCTAEDENTMGVSTVDCAPAAPRFRVNGHEGDTEHYQKLFIRQGTLCGAVLMGDLSGMAALLDQLTEGGHNA